MGVGGLLGISMGVFVLAVLCVVIVVTYLED